MKNLNTVKIIAAVSELALVFAKNGTPIVSGTLATKSGVKMKNGFAEMVSFVPFKFIGKEGNPRAEILAAFVSGTGLEIEGRFNTRSWTDDNGKTHSKTELLVRRFDQIELAAVGFAVNGTPIAENGFNQASIGGRLTQDPFVIPGDAQITRLTVAINEKYGEKEYTAYVSVTTYGELAGMAATFKKGELVSVTGRVTHEGWKTSDGQKRRELRLEANHISKSVGSLKTPEPVVEEEVPFEVPAKKQRKPRATA
jgi:single-stranded DNA-binding protein